LSKARKTAMIISVASGKGGTGKTTVATNLARAVDGEVQLLDCDVEEPNCHLFLHPELASSQDVCVKVPQVDVARCTYCGECATMCRFSAIVVVRHHVLTFPELCHGCGGCAMVCDRGAISETDRPLGVVERGSAGSICFIHGRLNVAEAMSPPLIKAVRALAQEDGLVIVDSPPGTSCPVIASVKGSDFCVLVTEPTPFGLNDLHLAVQVVEDLGIPKGVVINRADVGDDEVKCYLEARGIPLLMEIPEDRRIAEAYSRGEMLIDLFPEYRARFQGLLDGIRGHMRARIVRS
jgi:MinD superfamily P-loop ATPase